MDEIGYIDPNGRYYEGDRQGTDTVVPKRPSSLHQWTGTAWAIPLADAKFAKCAEIKTAAEAAISSPLDTPYGFPVDTGLSDIIMWREGATMAAAAGLTEMTVRDYNNQTHVVSVADAQAISVLQAQFYQSMYQKKWRLQDQVSAAQTLEDVAAIVW